MLTTKVSKTLNLNISGRWILQPPKEICMFILFVWMYLFCILSFLRFRVFTFSSIFQNTNSAFVYRFFTHQNIILNPTIMYKGRGLLKPPSDKKLWLSILLVIQLSQINLTLSKKLKPPILFCCQCLFSG